MPVPDCIVNRNAPRRQSSRRIYPSETGRCVHLAQSGLAFLIFPFYLDLFP